MRYGLLKKIVVFSFTFIAVAGIGLHTNIIKLPIREELHPIYVTDFNDDRKLLGASHNVFVARVIKEIGNVNTDSVAQTQFEVEVFRNIKGDLKGNALINQQAGYKNGVLHIMAGDTLITEGETYIFATRFWEEENCHVVISHPNGKKLISNDKKLAINELESIVDEEKRIKELEEAYKNEILLGADILANIARNSYKDLQEKIDN